jgi:hypothetical protein
MTAGKYNAGFPTLFKNKLDGICNSGQCWNISPNRFQFLLLYLHQDISNEKDRDAGLILRVRHA